MTPSERAYYDQRAREYDDWYNGSALYAARSRPGFDEELAVLRRVVGALPFRRILDVACGTGYLTQHLTGKVTGLDYSESMLRIAKARLPFASLVRANALRLPFLTGSFECILTSHFYGHILAEDRVLFLNELRRVAAHAVFIDAGRHAGADAGEEVQDRILLDGSRHKVYKRYFTAAQLIEEIGGAQILHSGPWFVVAAY